MAMLTEREWHVLLLRHEGLRQSQIARRLRVTQGAVSRMETNARAKISAARRELALANKLGIAATDDDEGLERRLQDLVRGKPH
jgi:transcriptional regulator